MISRETISIGDKECAELQSKRQKELVGSWDQANILGKLKESSLIAYVSTCYYLLWICHSYRNAFCTLLMVQACIRLWSHSSLLSPHRASSFFRRPEPRGRLEDDAEIREMSHEVGAEVRGRSEDIGEEVAISRQLRLDQEIGCAFRKSSSINSYNLLRHQKLRSNQHIIYYIISFYDTDRFSKDLMIRCRLIMGLLHRDEILSDRSWGSSTTFDYARSCFMRHASW